MLIKHTSNYLKSDSKEHNCSYIATAILIIGYAISVIAYALNGKTLLDADESAELVLANHLNQTGRFLLSSDWYYSTELRVLNTQIVNKIALALFPNNWHAARTLSISILTAILVLSYLLLVRSANLGWVGVLTALALVVPFSTTYSYITLYGSFYVPHLSITFILLALTIQVIHIKSKKTFLYFILACLLSTLAGLGGVRQFLIFHAPLLLTSFIQLFKETHGYNSFQEIIKSKQGYTFLISAVLALFCALGILINIGILDKYYIFSDYTNTSLNSLDLVSFLKYLGSLINILGYEGCAELTDLTGAGAICGLLLNAIFGAGVIWCIKFYKIMSNTEQLLTGFFLSCVVTNVMIYSFGNLPLPRYLMPAGIMVLPLIPVAFSHRHGIKAPWRNIVCILFTICLLIQSTNNFWYHAFRDKGNVKSLEEQTANWLTESGYTNGIATFWNSSTMTELSDGKIDVWTVHSDCLYSNWSTIIIHEWLQTKDHRNSLPNGPVFLLLSLEEMDLLYNHPLGTITPSYQNQKYIVYTFNSINEMTRQLGGGSVPQISGIR